MLVPENELTYLCLLLGMALLLLCLFVLLSDYGESDDVR
jgi:hypothetical protein